MARIPPPGSSPGKTQPWWVFQELSGIPRDPGITAYVAIEQPNRAAAEKYAAERPGASLAAGPFATQDDANNWIDDKTGLPKCSPPTLAKQVKNKKGPNLNPLKGIDRIGAVLEAFFRVLADGAMWRSLAWLLLGAVMLLAGIATWAKSAGVPLPSAIPVPV